MQESAPITRLFEGTAAQTGGPDGGRDDKTPPNLRTFEVLEVLGRHPAPMSATEINTHLGLPKQTIHRLCATLEEAGLLQRVPGGRRYRPGMRARQMAAGILAATDGQIARHQILSEVARRTGETVNLVLQQDKGMVYLDRVETDWAFRIQLPVGTHVPFHCTASGKTYMAHMAPEPRSALVGALALERWTANTITDRNALLAELEVIRQRGYALDNQEFFDGMIAIAVPVLDDRGRFLAALATHGPAIRFSLEDAVARLDVLRDAAGRLGARLLD